MRKKYIRPVASSIETEEEGLLEGSLNTQAISYKDNKWWINLNGEIYSFDSEEAAEAYLELNGSSGGYGCKSAISWNDMDVADW